MISVHILYPRTDDSTFDMDYYMSTHMPMFAESIGEACTSWGASLSESGNFMAVGWAMIESQDALNAGLAEHGAKIMGDVPNYTNVRPDMVIGEVA